MVRRCSEYIGYERVFRLEAVLEEQGEDVLRLALADLGGRWAALVLQLGRPKCKRQPNPRQPESHFVGIARSTVIAYVISLILF